MRAAAPAPGRKTRTPASFPRTRSPRSRYSNRRPRAFLRLLSVARPPACAEMDVDKRREDETEEKVVEEVAPSRTSEDGGLQVGGARGGGLGGDSGGGGRRGCRPMCWRRWRRRRPTSRPRSRRAGPRTRTAWKETTAPTLAVRKWRALHRPRAADEPVWTLAAADVDAMRRGEAAPEPPPAAVTRRSAQDLRPRRLKPLLAAEAAKAAKSAESRIASLDPTRRSSRRARAIAATQSTQRRVEKARDAGLTDVSQLAIALVQAVYLLARDYALRTVGSGSPSPQRPRPQGACGGVCARGALADPASFDVEELILWWTQGGGKERGRRERRKVKAILRRILAKPKRLLLGPPKEPRGGTDDPRVQDGVRCLEADASCEAQRLAREAYRRRRPPRDQSECVCQICGLSLVDKTQLALHMRDAKKAHRKYEKAQVAEKERRNMLRKS